MVEVLGITEPGAQVTVNGQKVAVAEDGQFQARVVPSRARPDVVVECKKTSGVSPPASGSPSGLN